MNTDNTAFVEAPPFAERVKENKILIFYPRSQQRNLYLSKLLSMEKGRLIYHRVPYTSGEMGTALRAWLPSLLADIQAYIASGNGSAKRSQPILRDSAEDNGKMIAEMLNNFAADLKRNEQPLILYIDELDHLSQDHDFVSFMYGLGTTVSGPVKLAFNARRVALEPFQYFIENHQVDVFGTEERGNDVYLEPQETQDLRPQLEVYAFGRGHVFVNGKIVETWDGALPRQLFYYFVDNDLVTRNEIFQNFWPNLSRKEATNVFHVTKRKITERLSLNVLEGGNYELTNYSAGFYVPGDKLIRHYDVAEFEEAVELANTTMDEEEQAAALRRAISLYRFPYLQDYDMDWVRDRREKLRLLYADALIGMGRWYVRREDYEPALGHYVRALKEMPNREDIHRQVMEIYWRLGRHQDALAQYQLLSDHLKQTVGVAPSRETTEVYEKIRAEAS